MTSAGFPHVRSALLDRLLAGCAADPEVVQTAAHVAWCTECQAQLGALRHFEQALNGALRAGREASLVVRSPVGALTLVATDGGVRRVEFGGSPSSPRSSVHPVLRQAERELSEYFAGKRVDFEVPVDLEVPGTFQRDVLQAVRAIPAGSVRTYAALARQLGRPRAARAVGGALHRNPVPILVPCHRVVGIGGALVGYVGGIAAKQRLLELEGATLAV